MKRSIRGLSEKIFEWASVAAGLLILGSCTYVGFAENGPVIGTGMLLLGAIAAAVLVAFVFMVTRTSADIRAIREKLDGDKD